MSAVWSTIRRLISSGTRWSKQRLPASMWKTGILRRLAGKHREAGVGVAQHQHRVGLLPRQHPVGLDDDPADGLAGRVAHRFERVVRAAKAEIAEEDGVEFVVVVLAGVDQHMVEVGVEGRDHPRQPDQFRPRADDGHHLEAPSPSDGLPR